MTRFNCRWLLLRGFPDSSVGKESACHAGDPGLIPGSGRSPGEGKGYLLQYSWASLVAQLVRNLPAMWETWVGKISWRRERLPILVFWPGEFHGLYSPWGLKESDMTERLSHKLFWNLVYFVATLTITYKKMRCFYSFIFQQIFIHSIDINSC